MMLTQGLARDPATIQPTFPPAPLLLLDQGSAHGTYCGGWMGVLLRPVMSAVLLSVTMQLA